MSAASTYDATKWDGPIETNGRLEWTVVRAMMSTRANIVARMAQDMHLLHQTYEVATLNDLLQAGWSGHQINLYAPDAWVLMGNIDVSRQIHDTHCPAASFALKPHQ